MHMNNKGLMLVFFTALISGFSIFINSFSVRGFDSSVFTFSKNILVAIFLISIIISFEKVTELKNLKINDWKKLVFIGLLGGSIPFLLFFKGLQMTTGTASSFIHKTLFIFVALFAILFLKEKLSKTFFIGASLILIGTYYLIKPNFDLNIGHLFILIATIFWAAENTYSKYVLKKLSGTLVAFGRMFFGSLFILIFLILTDKSSIIISMTLEQYLWILLTSIFLLMYVFTYYNGLKYIKVTTAASVLAIGAPISILLNYFYNGITLTLSQSFGIFLIFLGMISILWLTKILHFLTKQFRVESHERN